jgi:hypothetical protein
LAEFSFEFPKEFEHGDAGRFVLEGRELNGAKHAEGGQEFLEDDENPDGLKRLFVKFGGADL